MNQIVSKAKVFKLFAMACLLSLCACQLAYAPNILQGNITSKETVAKITKGMQKEEVIRILGTPIFESALDNTSIVEYIHFEQKRDKTTNYKRITITFANNKVTTIAILEK